MGVLAAKAVASLCLPPGLFIVLAVWGLLWRRSHPRAGRALVIASVVLLTVASLPPVATSLVRTLEIHPPLASAPGYDAHSAIVVLGGGRYPDAPEYGGEDTVSGPVLERLRYAVWLHRRSLLPVLVAGGNLVPGDVPESEIIAASLRADFSLVPRWVETASRTTRENARHSAALLAQSGIRRVYLVTHAWHARRAVQAFRAAGLEVVAAPTMFSTVPETRATVLYWLPSMAALQATHTALYEYLGAAWYRVSGT